MAKLTLKQLEDQCARARAGGAKDDMVITAAAAGDIDQQVDIDQGETTQVDGGAVSVVRRAQMKFLGEA